MPSLCVIINQKIGDRSTVRATSSSLPADLSIKLLLTTVSLPPPLSMNPPARALHRQPRSVMLDSVSSAADGRNKSRLAATSVNAH